MKFVRSGKSEPEETPDGRPEQRPEENPEICPENRFHRAQSGPEGAPERQAGLRAGGAENGGEWARGRRFFFFFFFAPPRRRPQNRPNCTGARAPRPADARLQGAKLYKLALQRQKKHPLPFKSALGTNCGERGVRV